MNKPEDQHFAWFLFKSAFSLFWAIMLFVLVAIFDEDKAVEGISKLIEDIKNDPEL